MKTIKRVLFSLFILMMVLQSCSTKVDLYADYKPITVVYGLLDFTQDTNYIKINKAFLGPGNALDIALIEDSCNYPGKLNCRIIESKASAGSNYFTQTRVLEVDTITIHNKELGIFYAPDQLVYYTKDRINNNNQYVHYRYDLEIDRGDTILTASTGVVGGSRFAIPQAVMNFSMINPTGTVGWTPCTNAAIYDVTIEFKYYEVKNLIDTLPCSMKMTIMDPRPETDISYEQGVYSTSYHSQDFYNSLAQKIGADSLQNVERLIFEPSVTIKISAGGDELYNFISVNGPSNSIVQTIPEYTNVNGGYGVFSSRTAISKKVKLSAQTYTELSRHESWNFRQAR